MKFGYDWLITITSQVPYGLRYQGGESRGFNDGVHGISCRYPDKTGRKINYISSNTYSIFIQSSANTKFLISQVNHSPKCFSTMYSNFPLKSEQSRNNETVFLRTWVENFCTLWSNSEMNVCFE